MSNYANPNYYAYNYNPYYNFNYEPNQTYYYDPNPNYQYVSSYCPDAYYEPQIPEDHYIFDGFNLIIDILKKMNIKSLTRDNMNRVLRIIYENIRFIVSGNATIHFVMKNFKLWKCFRQNFLRIFKNSDDLTFNLYCANFASANDNECDDRFILKLAMLLSQGNTNVIIVSNDNFESFSKHINLISTGIKSVSHQTGNKIDISECDINLGTEFEKFPHCKYNFVFEFAKNVGKLILKNI
jgi:hypothetical protein